MKFVLYFTGSLYGESRGITSELSVDSLDHPLKEGRGYYLSGPTADDEVDLFISYIELQQESGKPETHVSCELDKKHLQDGRVSQAETDKIRRVLEHNSWNWDVPVARKTRGTSSPE